ncbi:MAG: hypothetical protein M1827_007354 [Pycnora praestabilis]|nr:MAG: hypothetical protein M1827_007354 [Pycnora praestabilis]
MSQRPLKTSSDTTRSASMNRPNIQQDDEASSKRDPLRSSPRDSKGQAISRAIGNETPLANLRHLAGIIQKPSTPLRRASSAGPSSTKRSARPTPAGRARTPGPSITLRPTSTKHGAPTTPHAIRALQQRRAAALTPGRDRRRSGRVRRETPRDVLRGLSRILARGTKPTELSSQVLQPNLDEPAGVDLQDDDLEKEPDLPQPRLSLALDEEEDNDSFYIRPPRLSVPLDDDNNTQQSVELPRRAISEQPWGRLSRGSFGSIRTSDRFADLNELGLDAVSEGRNEGSFIRPGFDDDYGEIGMDTGLSNLGDISQDPQRAPFDEVGGPSRYSDLRPATLQEDEDDATFVFDIPDLAHSRSPSREPDIGPEPELREPGQHRSASGHASYSHREEIHKGAKWKKEFKLSRHGTQYTSLPTGVIKKLASKLAQSSGNGKAKLRKDTLAAIVQATDWFFEQVSDDLGTYAGHAARKTIEESDVITLMKRQRQINATTTPFSVAQKYLPRELLQEVRMAPPIKIRAMRQYLLPVVNEEDNQEAT